MAAVGRVYDSLITRGAASNVTRGLLVPGITAAFAIANVADTIYTAVKTGNAKDAFTALINAPGIVAGAFFNGYRPYFGRDENGDPIYAGEDFQGLFSPLGTIDQFFVRLPQAIAAALKPPVEETSTVATVPSTANLVTLATSTETTAADSATGTDEADDVTEADDATDESDDATATDTDDASGGDGSGDSAESGAASSTDSDTGASATPAKASKPAKASTAAAA